MKFETAKRLLTLDIDKMALEQIQRHKVKLLDAWRQSTGFYGMAEAVQSGFYLIVASESAEGFSPKDPWLSHNLMTRYEKACIMEEKRLDQRRL